MKKYKTSEERRAYMAAYREKNREHVRAQQKAWREKNRAKATESTKAWQRKNPEPVKRSRRKSRLMREYGLTMEAYDHLLSRAGHVCEVCKKPETSRDSRGNQKPLAVDHDHRTGSVRGVLCSGCNAALGLARESPELLERLAAYAKERCQ